MIFCVLCTKYHDVILKKKKLTIFLTGRVTGYLGRVGLTRNKIGSDHGSTRFCFGSKKSGSGQVFFWSGQKILTNIAMSTSEEELEGTLDKVLVLFRLV